MFDTIVEFQEVHDDDPCNKLKAAQAGHFRLHSDLIHCKVMSVSFIDKLSVYKRNLGRREFRQFPTLMTLNLTYFSLTTLRGDWTVDTSITITLAAIGLAVSYNNSSMYA